MSRVDYWSCPLDLSPLDFETENTLVCTHCHTEYPVIQNHYGFIPCLLPPPRDKVWISDPGMYFPEAWKLANELSKTWGSFADLVDLYYEHLRPNIPPDLFKYRKDILLSRKVTPTSDEVCNASLCMDSVGRPFPKPGKIFEIGVGWGFSLASIKNVFPEAIYGGVDLCPPILVIAQRLLYENSIEQPYLAIADCSKSIPVRANQFEFVFSESVVEHVLDQHHFMKEVGRILAEHSAFFFSVPARYHFYPECHFNIRFLGFLPWSIRRKVVADRYRLAKDQIEYIYLYSFFELKKLMEINFPNDLLAVKGRYATFSSPGLKLISLLIPKLGQVGWEALVYKDPSNVSSFRKGKLPIFPKIFVFTDILKKKLKNLNRCIAIASPESF